MYTITCDGLPILDLRDDDYIVDSPRVKMEVNTVGEGSFKIFKTHPHYESMKKLKSVFEVRDDYGVIFRGRMTDSTTDFNNGKNVDLEGVMAYFNDSLIKPFGFPADFLDNAAYNAAAKSGNVVEFLLGWIIEQHNNQVQPFQQFKLGNVTVTDPNNYLYRRREAGHITSWEALKTRLFDSVLGGYLCIRYEADGNYIDYLEDFEEVNTQEIVFGENLLDFLLEEDATATYTAMVPYGAELEAETEEEGERPHLTIESLPDGNITEDIVKSGDTLYSKSGVERFGWIYAPISETTWDDVTVAENLQNKGVARLEKTAVFLKNTIELSAADLHYTDDQIMSFRIYKKVKVVSKPHGLSELYRLTELEIPLMEPQNMKITVGETRKTLLSMQKDEQYFTQQNMQVITEKVATVDKATREAVEKLKVTDETLTNWCHENDKTLIDGAKIYSGSIFAEQIAAHTLTSEQINVESLFSQRIEANNLDVVAGELQLSTDRLSGKDSFIDMFALDNGGEFDFKITPHAITSWSKATALQPYYDAYSIITPYKFEIKEIAMEDGTMRSATLMDEKGVHVGLVSLTREGVSAAHGTGETSSLTLDADEIFATGRLFCGGKLVATTDHEHGWVTFNLTAGENVEIKSIGAKYNTALQLVSIGGYFHFTPSGTVTSGTAIEALTVPSGVAPAGARPVATYRHNSTTSRVAGYVASNGNIIFRVNENLTAGTAYAFYFNVVYHAKITMAAG